MPKIDIRAIKKQAIDEYTAVIERLTLLAQRKGGETGCAHNIKVAAREELLDFLCGEKK